MRVERGRLALEDFLRLISEHQATLSPPGRGFDCFRTWQALALGTVPLVVDSGSFDARLLHGTGPQLITSPDELTPDSLGALLAGLSDPAPHAPHVEMAHWRRVWEAALAAPSVDE